MDSNNLPSEIEFPPLPEYRALWSPLRYEPIQGSGERITVAVAAIGDDDRVRVITTASPRQLRCLFGDAADGISDIAGLVQSSLEEHLKREQSVEGWASPVAGFSIDDPRTALAHNIDEALIIGAMETSFLSAANPNIRDLDNPDDVTPEEQSWANQIIDATLSMEPGLKHAFGRTFSVREGMKKTRIDFLGSRLVAGFGKVQSGSNVSYYEQRARSKLWQMRVLRDYMQQNELIEIPHVDLLLNTPATYASDRDRTAVENTIDLIEAEADMGKIRLFRFTDAEAAAAHIVKREAA